MRRDEYPEAHDVVLVTRELGGATKSFDSVESVLIDGHPLCLPKDVDVVLTASAGGLQYVTVTILAKSVTSQHYDPPLPKHMKAS